MAELAFPVSEDTAKYPGMSLRDYFAARFMDRAQCLCEDISGSWDFDHVANCAYEMADAMLKARSDTSHGATK